MKDNISRSYASRSQWLRRLASRRRDKAAFVLSGGGPLGALQVGTLKALIERGVRPELVVGTSVGALNAAFVAFDPTPEGIARLERHWRAFRDGDLFPGGRFRVPWARMLRRGNSVFEHSGLRRMIEIGLGPEARFEDAVVPLGVVATDIDSGVERLFASGPLMDPLLASAAMPGIFPPIEIDGHTYTDGGVANNVPMAPAVSMGAKTLYVLNATSHSHQRRPLIRPMDYLLHSFALARSQRLFLEQPFYSDRVRVVMLPSPALDFYVPFASMAYTDRLIKLAYEETVRFLDGAAEVAVAKMGDGELEAIYPPK
ncbi:MAG: patatin-like phospholipase family protein [Actinomycetota bacterium]|nr:patatin-like phospholipase family protein [Actinomycetota bacterium]